MILFPSRPLRPALVLTGILASASLLSACAAQAPSTSSVPRQVPAIAVAAEPVRRGEIQQTVSYSGDIRARSQITVLPKVSGRVGKLLVDVGSRVKAGDILAELERDSAQIQADQAGAALAAAEARLAQLQAGGRAEDIGLAAAGLVAQQARLELMQLGGREETIAQAQAGLDAVQARLALVQKGATNDLRQAAQSAVDSDKAALASAETALASLGGTSVADLQAAQSQVDSLKAQVTSAEAALANLTGSSAADVQAAQSAYDAAVAARTSARAALDQARAPITAQLEQAQVAVAAAQASLDSARSNRTALNEGTVASLSGACYKTGSGRTDATVCDAALASADSAAASALQALTSAQAQLDLLRDGGTPAAQAAQQAALDQAEANVKSTRARLDALQTGGVEAQRALVQSQLVGARENLKVAQARLRAVQNGSLDAQKQAAQAQVVAARERLKSDQARLEQVQGGPQDEEILQAEAAVRQAEQQLALATNPVTTQDLRAQRALVEQARLQLEKARNPYVSYDLQAAQAAADQAKAQLAMAELNLQETTVQAPVEGIVADRLVSPGAMVSPSTPLLTLVPPAMELVVNVEESQLGQIAEGQAVTLQVPAFPGQTFKGLVKTIAPTVDARSRTASVRIEPTDGDGKLRAGMFARLSIVTASKLSALLVPREAVLSGAPGSQASVVAVDEGNKARKLPVQLGLGNDRLVEVLSGLNEGQLLITSGLADLTDGDLVTPQVPSTTALAQ